MDDEIMARTMQAVELGRAGRTADARSALEQLWDTVGPDGDALHRCSIAHYAADVQESDAAELMWDERALAAVVDLTDVRAQEFHGSLQVRAFLPSLQLNLADDHRRLGAPDRARTHLAAAHELSAVLPDDDYGRLVRRGIADVESALASGSAARIERP